MKFISALFLIVFLMGDAGAQQNKEDDIPFHEIILLKWEFYTPTTILVRWCVTDTDTCGAMLVFHTSETYQTFLELFFAEPEYVPLHVVMRVKFDRHWQPLAIYAPAFIATDRPGEVDYDKYPFPPNIVMNENIACDLGTLDTLTGVYVEGYSSRSTSEDDLAWRRYIMYSSVTSPHRKQCIVEIISTKNGNTELSRVYRVRMNGDNIYPMDDDPLSWRLEYTSDTPTGKEYSLRSGYNTVANVYRVSRSVR